MELGGNGVPMDLIIREEPIALIEEHATIRSSFVVERCFDVSTPNGGLGDIVLTEVAVEPPWLKDYDAIKGEGPTRWPKRFDTSNWGLIAAHRDDARVGGAVIAFNTAGINMLEGRRDLAVLWDIRVRSDVRSQGVGRALFQETEKWARSQGCRTLKVETQNINVPACRFYSKMGCTLGAIDRYAYLDLPNEVQLLWFKELGSAHQTGPDFEDQLVH
jgi:GNAT superfamily N-acetyltransferase